jgi:hypothetical protein
MLGLKRLTDFYKRNLKEAAAHIYICVCVYIHRYMYEYLFVIKHCRLKKNG